MVLRHKEKHYLLTVTSKKGQMVVGKDGLAIIERGYYKGMHKVSSEKLLEKFEIVA
jgi:hypothetical protein